MKPILMFVAVLILSNIATVLPTMQGVTTVPPTTQGVTTVPPTTQDVTTVPPATQDVTTVPPATQDVTTVPPATQDVTTVPPASNSTTVPPTSNNTTVQPASNTTVQPTNITTHIPSTTHIPTPKRWDQFIVAGADGTNCIVMSTEISYQYTHKNISEDGSIFSNATYNGSCSDTTDELLIHSSKVHLDLVFSKNSSVKFLKKVVLSFANRNLTISKDNMTELLLKNTEYFICKSSKKVTFDDLSITFTNLTLDIFRNSSSIDAIGTKHICKEDMKTSSIVPIAVGAALAGLVIAVLIAYLIGRKRSRRGYESV